jgi:hypothetical protein
MVASTRVPRHPYVNPLSSSAIKTIIVIFQGAQALYELVAPNSVSNKNILETCLGTVFAPLAVFGLLRLPAALWMSEDWSYADEDVMEYRAPSFKLKKSKSDDQDFPEAERSTSTVSLLAESHHDPAMIRFRDANGPHGIAVRATYLLLILALTGFTMYLAIPYGTTESYVTATVFTQNMFFLFFLLATSFIFIFYFLRGNSTTTIIPCITSTWYKLYTALLLLGMLVLVIFSAIETRKTWCGAWTTFPEHAPGHLDRTFSVCPLAVSIKTSELSWGWNNGTGDGTTILKNFTGLISGNWSSAEEH